MNMLAHNKIQASGVVTQFNHIPQSQNKGIPSDFRESTYNIHYGNKIAARRDKRCKDSQDLTQSDIYILQPGQRQQHKYYSDRHRNLSQRYGDKVVPQPRHSKSMDTIRSTTIHPTIANMVSPTSPKQASLSPQPSFCNSFSSISCPPSTSPRIGNAPISPEWESERLDHHHYYRSHSPPPTRDIASASEVMEMDQGYTLEELDSDSMMMDQCEPQNSWSSSSSQLTNSPSPVMSCTPHQFPILKRQSSFSISSSNRYSQQDPPPPQQQPLRDHNPRPQSIYSAPTQGNHSFRSSRDNEHHRMHKLSFDSSDLVGSNTRKRSPSLDPLRIIHPRPYSFPTGNSLIKREIPGIGLPSSDRSKVEYTSTSYWPRTPPNLNFPPHPQFESKKRERVTERERDPQKRQAVLHAPKASDHMSEAQKMLYERHPPSPQPGQSSTSSSAPSSPRKSSPGAISPSRLEQHIPFKRSRDDLPRRIPHLHVANDTIEYRSSQKLSSEQLFDTWQDQGIQQPKPSMHLIPPRRSYSESDGCTNPLEPSFSSMSRSSPSLLPSPLTSESATVSTPIPSLPRTEGMTVIKNEDGAIAVYNPITYAMTFRCELCPNESFGRIHDLKRHQTSKHQEMTWPCDFCHRPFVRRDALLRHYTVKAARDDGLHPASHEIEKILAARARAKMLY